MWCSVVRCGVVRCGAVWEVWCGVVQHTSLGQRHPVVLQVHHLKLAMHYGVTVDNWARWKEMHIAHETDCFLSLDKYIRMYVSSICA